MWFCRAVFKACPNWWPPFGVIWKSTISSPSAMNGEPTERRFWTRFPGPARRWHGNLILIKTFVIHYTSVAQLKYKVGETWHDLSPPPPHIIPQVLTELASLVGLQDRAFPAEGKIDIPLSGTHLRWKVQLSNTDAHCFAITPDN